jgi:hypothetical protein
MELVSEELQSFIFTPYVLPLVKTLPWARNYDYQPSQYEWNSSNLQTQINKLRGL